MNQEVVLHNNLILVNSEKYCRYLRDDCPKSLLCLTLFLFSKPVSFYKNYYDKQKGALNLLAVPFQAAKYVQRDFLLPGYF